ncbi:ABC transporter ATP-binding protein [Desulfobacter postgatei]|jgi:ABC-type polysaccharide/polyol phosphate transport system ATPase subunit|uniref:ABC transporter ATP-binding protein n=1 Tax=Desulfobacter postgatei TaxID=2293 RepID=UPI002A35BD85|nr:ABC transporter ATP-binding protein [Desulfobacter postgatei]MDX9964231.1 ABC transporter ATP-binding protein [Desulfobacter postgatei]
MSIIKVENVTKEYKLGQLSSLKDSLQRGWARLGGRSIHDSKQFHALDNINFSVDSGEVVGIIGTNGAGKSTLLKLISGITNPTSGNIVVKGKIAPLIEVGAGLHPELTGRENIFLNASIMGIPKAIIRRRFDDIVSFAEIEAFIDTPIKRYSSGMMVRLGFSIATSVDADILVVDEVLAVGDLAFQRKCFDRMESMIRRQGKTVLLVSHNIRQVERLCSRAILLDHGKILEDGNKTMICEQFYRLSNAKIAAQLTESQIYNRHIRKTDHVELLSISILNEKECEKSELVMGESLIIRCIINAKVMVKQPEVIVGFQTTDFFYVASMGNGHMDSRPNLEPGVNTIDCHIDCLPLMPGVYALRLGILDGIPSELFYGEMLKSFTVKASHIPQSKMPTLGVVHIPVEWRYEKGVET